MSIYIPVIPNFTIDNTHFHQDVNHSDLYPDSAGLRKSGSLPLLRYIPSSHGQEFWPFLVSKGFDDETAVFLDVMPCNFVRYYSINSIIPINWDDNPFGYA